MFGKCKVVSLVLYWMLALHHWILN